MVPIIPHRAIDPGPPPPKIWGVKFFSSLFHFLLYNGLSDFDNFLRVGRACEHLHSCKKLPKSDEWILFYMDFKLWPTLTSDACSFFVSELWPTKFSGLVALPKGFLKMSTFRVGDPPQKIFGGRNFCDFWRFGQKFSNPFFSR